MDPTVAPPVDKPISQALVPSRGSVALSVLSGSQAGHGWACRAIELPDADTLRVRFETNGGLDWLEVVVTTRSDGQRVFRRLRHCVVRYNGRLRRTSPAQRSEIAALVNGLALMVDDRLDAAVDATIAQVLGRTNAERRIVEFNREAMLAFLEPEIVLGRPLNDGWTLSDVYPSTGQAPGSQAAAVEYALDFRRADDGQRLAILVAPRSEQRPGFAHSAHFTLIHLTLGRAPDAGAQTVCALVSYAFQLRDHDGLEVRLPSAPEELAQALLRDAPKALPAPATPSDVRFNLALDADCDQACVFCCIKSLRPPEDGGDLTFARATADLTEARRQGIRLLRLNGYDPLAYSRVLDVLAFAMQLGFEAVDIYSPCTRLADPAFFTALLRVVHVPLLLHVPLYGAVAATHDLCVATAGAFTRVRQAIDLAIDRLGPRSVRILTVVLRQNVAELSDIVQLADRLGISLAAHLPYPSSEAPTDPYFRAAPDQADVADAIARLWQTAARRFWIKGLAPCIAYRRFTADSVAPRHYLGYPEQILRIPGTEYRSTAYAHRKDPGGQSAFEVTTLACPHARNCALQSICPGEILRAYADRYGLEAFQPVNLSDLLLTGHRQNCDGMNRR